MRKSRDARRILVKVLVELCGGLEEAQSSRGAMKIVGEEKSHGFELNCIVCCRAEQEAVQVLHKIRLVKER